MSNRRPFQIGLGWVLVALVTLPPMWFVRQHLYGKGDDANLAARAAALVDFPERLGEWQQVDHSELPEEAQALLKYREAWVRIYRRHRDHAEVTAVLMVGSPGPIVRHPPEVCYHVRGNREIEQSERITLAVGGNEHTFRVSHFQPKDALGKSFATATAWSANGTFATSDRPRITFGAAASIYAVQVLCHHGTSIEGEAVEATLQGFLAEFLSAFPTIYRGVTPPQDTTQPETVAKAG